MEQIMSRDRVLWDKVERADHFLSRLKGLLGKRQLSPGEGLLITPCNQVHTFFMRFPIDVVSITKDFRIACVETLSPGKIGKRIKNAAYILEVAAGSAGQFMLASGDAIAIHSVQLEDNRANDG